MFFLIDVPFVQVCTPFFETHEKGFPVMQQKHVTGQETIKRSCRSPKALDAFHYGLGLVVEGMSSIKNRDVSYYEMITFLWFSNILLHIGS